MTVPDLTKGNPATAFQDALAAIRNPAFIKTPKYQEQQTRAVTDGADPEIVEFARKLVKRLAGMGVPVFAHCIVRTKEEQLRLFNEGFSKDTPKDGLWPHMAYAVDIIHGKLAWMDGIPNAWPIIGHVGKEVALSMGINIVWGGDWKLFPDPCHFEIADWKDRQRRANAVAVVRDIPTRQEAVSMAAMLQTAEKLKQEGAVYDVRSSGFHWEVIRL